MCFYNLKGGCSLNKADLQKIRIRILKQIYLAKYASDYAKGYYSLPPLDEKYDSETYYDKDAQIVAAIKTIDQFPQVGVEYSITEKPDQNGKKSLVVYFLIKMKDRKTIQISFHNFSFKKLHPTKKKRRWAKNQKSFDNALLILAEIRDALQAPSSRA